MARDPLPENKKKQEGTDWKNFIINNDNKNSEPTIMEMKTIKWVECIRKPDDNEEIITAMNDIPRYFRILNKNYLTVNG